MTLWYFNIEDFPDVELQRHLLVLPKDIVSDIDRYRFIDDKKFRLVARLLLWKYAQDNNLIWDWGQWKRTSTNKPFMQNGPYFNISHSGKMVLVAISTEQELGVDIEYNSDIDITSISHYLHEDEIAFLKQKGNNQNNFYKVWTRKEALLKAIGIGLLEGVNHFNVLSDVIKYQRTWFLQDLQVAEGYSAAVCYPIKPKNNIIQKVEFNELNNFINEKIIS